MLAKKIKKLFKNPKEFFNDFRKNYSYKKNLTKLMKNDNLINPVFCFKISAWKRNFFENIYKNANLIYFPSNLKEKDFDKFWSNLILQNKKSKLLVWGLSTPKYIIEFTKKNNIEVTYIEDGFIRSIGLGSSHSLPLSLSFDTKTPYFNANEESDLEEILNNYNFKINNSQILSRAKRFKKRLLEKGISKYNNTDKLNLLEIYGEKTKKRILVVGQVEDDASIKYGCDKQFNNNDLVRLAHRENPDAQIIYKPHPDVLFKKREKLSNPDEVKDISVVIEKPFPIAQAFETIDHVYTITSQAGFEALIRNIPVTTIGCPFYSGWGLTDDRQKNDRRKRELSIDELFAGAYILYPKYFNPKDYSVITPEDALEILINEKEKNITKELSNNYSTSKDLIKNTNNFIEIENYQNTSGIFYGWGRKKSGQKAISLAKKHNTSYVLLEDGFIRSLDLGVKESPSFSIVEDDIGIYYDATVPSRLENILLSYDFSSDVELMDKVYKAIELIKKYHVSKYNSARDVEEIPNLVGNDECEVGNDEREVRDEIPNLVGNDECNVGNEKRVLIIAQTAGDSSLEYGLGNSFTTDEMINAAIEENPDCKIYLKIHPDVLSGKKSSDIDIKNIDKNISIISEDVNPISLLKHFSKVYTKTSGMGFEALILGCECVCFGMPFYAGWGITDDRVKCDRRSRKLTVVEVFAAAYILYTRYVNPYSKKEIDIIETIETIAEMKQIGC